MKQILSVLPLLLLLLFQSFVPEKLWPWALSIAFALPFVLHDPGEGFTAFGRSKNQCIELLDPFEAEVLLNGHLVARLSDRVVTEMLWRDYRIEAVDEAGQKAISDDALWDHCLFDFRDPKSGRVCFWAFPGGGPHVRDSRVAIRGMYFPEGSEEEMWQLTPRPDGISPWTLAEIQQTAASESKFLHETAAQHPALTWVPGVLPLAREFEELTKAQPLDAVSIANFSERLKSHVLDHRIKSFGAYFWHVDGLQKLADESQKTSAMS